MYIVLSLLFVLTSSAAVFQTSSAAVFQTSSAAVFQTSSAAVFQKVVLSSNPDALCLDGTHGAYYINRGDAKKIVINFEGGGWCGGADIGSTIDQCYQRSLTALGSSSSYSETISESQGILSDNPQSYFHNWTKVFLKYCTGTGHQGYKATPVNYKGKDIYFRGHNVTIGQLESIDSTTKFFSEATHIVVTGQSAGGLATFLWTNYIAQRAPNAAVWSLPDSGIFLDSVHAPSNTHLYRIQFQSIMKYANVQIDLPTKQCVAAYKDEMVKCFFAEYLHPFIKVPLFAIQSLYDSWCLPNILGITCVNGNSLKNCNARDRSYVEDYHQNTSKVLLAIGQKSQNGYWAPVCVNHVYSFGALYSSSYRVPAYSPNSLNKGITDWMDNAGQNNKHMDEGAWPSNAPCAGATISLQIMS